MTVLVLIIIVKLRLKLIVCIICAPDMNNSSCWRDFRDQMHIDGGISRWSQRMDFFIWDKSPSNTLATTHNTPASKRLLDVRAPFTFYSRNAAYRVVVVNVSQHFWWIWSSLKCLRTGIPTQSQVVANQNYFTFWWLVNFIRIFISLIRELHTPFFTSYEFIRKCHLIK